MEVLSRIYGTFLMQHSTPASLFADHAAVSVLWAGDRYVLTLRDEVTVPPQAARSILEGWGWVDSRCEGLVAAFRRHNVDLRIARLSGRRHRSRGKHNALPLPARQSHVRDGQPSSLRSVEGTLDHRLGSPRGLQPRQPRQVKAESRAVYPGLRSA